MHDRHEIHNIFVRNHEGKRPVLEDTGVDGRVKVDLRQIGCPLSHHHTLQS
jgi:hypothetical protein